MASFQASVPNRLAGLAEQNLIDCIFPLYVAHIDLEQHLPLGLGFFIAHMP